MFSPAEVFSALLAAPASASPAGSAAAAAGGGQDGSLVGFPAACMARESRENGYSGMHRNGNGNYVDDEANDIVVSESTHKCYYEGEIYEDGSQWKPHADCQMCSCQVSRCRPASQCISLI